MNEKITFPRLAALLADKSGRSKRFSEDFLREFFSLISERLEAGDSVKVKGLGTFRLSRVESRRSVDVNTGDPMEISGHSKVVFIPAKELAEAVNAPFEAFTAIDISDDADLSTIFTGDEINLQESEASIEGECNPAYDPFSFKADIQNHDICTSLSETTDMTTDKANYPTPTEMPEELDNEPSTVEILTEEEKKRTPAEMPEEENGPSTVEIPTEEEKESMPAEIPTEEEMELTPAEMPKEDEMEPEPAEMPEEEEFSEEDGYEPQSRSKTWMKTLGIIFGAAVFALIATFAVWYVFATNDFNRRFNRTASNTTHHPTEGFVIGHASASEEAAVTPIIEEDTASETQDVAEESEVPTAPSDAIVYDTISTTRYLTTMAKSHYGNYNLWPYIYEENKAYLGHPDRIRPGTPVVIPKLSKYGVDPTNSDDIEKAKKMGVEIYARYGKKI